MKALKQKSILILFLLFAPFWAWAHENYVLPGDQINRGMRDWSINVLSALKDPVNLRLSLVIGLLIGFGIILFYFFQKSNFGLWLDTKLEKLQPFGHVVLRVALAVSFLASAATSAFLGPEISIFSLPLGSVIRILLFVLGIMLALGVYSEVVGAVSLVIITLATFVWRDYIFTYFNYFGEFLALIFFGSRIFSVDRIMFGLKKLQNNLKKYEVALIRITYGISVLYPAITIKLLHPIIIIQIVNQYHLNQFHWLFPHDPLLISLGAGLTQVLVGTFLILGFETRLSTFITFVLMVLSVIFFQESVWPHVILLALALYLMITGGGEWSLDHKLMRRSRN
jgi:uncharacterized membrane protein YphA (DoxX/SURF4 family)